jgi:hypothetical protein
LFDTKTKKFLVQEEEENEACPFLKRVKAHDYLDFVFGEDSKAENTSLISDGACFHFPKDESPYVEWSNDKERRVIFRSSKFHKQTNTWQGQGVRDGKRHRVILTFSDEWDFVTRGALIVENKVSNMADHIRLWFDGTWKIIPHRQNSNAILVQVENSIVQLNGQWRRLVLQESQDTTRGPYYVACVDTMDMKTCMLRTKFDVPPTQVGDTIVWEEEEEEETDASPTMTSAQTWIRQTEATSSSTRRILDLRERLRRICPQKTHMKPSYCKTELYGNTFCQGLRVGLASYHFVNSSCAYISYQHIDVSDWPLLDNARPIPARVYFRNIEFRSEDNIFRGDILWKQDYGTSWQGCSQWKYEMKFDSQMLCIVSGTVHSIYDDGETKEMSKFGEALIYVNAALFGEFRRRITQNYHAIQHEVIEPVQRDPMEFVFHHLRDEGASLHVIRMMQMIYQYSLMNKNRIEYL